MKNYILGSLTDYDEWIKKSFPTLNDVSMIDGGYQPIDPRYMHITSIIEDIINGDKKTLYDLDVENIEYALTNTGVTMDNIIDVSRSSIFTISDIRLKILDIITSSYTQGGLFVREALSRGICEPYYIISVLLEFCILSLRENVLDPEKITTMDDLGLEFNYKIFLSILSSLNTSPRRELNVLRYHMDRGDFNDLTKEYVYNDIYMYNTKLKTLLAVIYKECLSILKRSTDVYDGFLMYPLTTPSENKMENKNFLFKIIPIKEMR